MAEFPRGVLISLRLPPKLLGMVHDEIAFQNLKYGPPLLTVSEFIRVAIDHRVYDLNRKRKKNERLPATS